MRDGVPSGLAAPGIDNGYAADYRVRFDEAGPDGRIRTSTLLRYAQDVAWRHSEDLGFDRTWYAERGLNWVVRGVELEVFRPIEMGTSLRVATAVIGHRRIWARRLAEVGLADGDVAASIVTDWVILDLRGRPVRIPADFGLHFQNPEIDGDILRVAADGAMAGRTFRLTVRPHDLDPLGHANNAAYLDWLEEALVAGRDAADRAGALPRSVRLEYLASAGPGDELEIATRQADGEWQARIHRTDGAVVLRASGGAH